MIIRYYTDTNHCYSLNGGNPIGMKIYAVKDVIYDGIVPQSEKSFVNLFELLFPSNKDIENINDAIHNKMIEQ